VNGSRDRGEIRGHMMLEAVRANKVQELLHFGDFDYSRAAESVQRIVGKLSFSHVTAHLALGIVGGETRKAHLFRLDESDARPKGVFFAYSASDDFLEVHPHGPEEVLRQVRAVKAHSLVGIVAIIIVPIQQGLEWFYGKGYEDQLNYVLRPCFRHSSIARRWLCYHARHNDVYFDGRLISDIFDGLGFVRGLQQQGVKRAYAIFNNCYSDYAVRNADDLTKLLA